MAKTNKTPLEIVAEARIRLAAAEAKAARSAASENPVIVEMTDCLDMLNKQINVNSRQMNGPNSFANRRYAAEKRAEWIGAQENLIGAQDQLLRSQKSILQEAIARTSVDISSGLLPTQSAQEIIESLPQDDFAELVTEELRARKTWKNSTPAAIISSSKALSTDTLYTSN